MANSLDGFGIITTFRPVMHRRHFVDLLRRVSAASGAALVLALVVFAASPELHGWLHTGDSDSGEHSCAVTLFAGGVSLPLGTVAVAAPNTAWHERPAAAVTEVFLVLSRYLRQPERGPPVS